MEDLLAGLEASGPATLLRSSVYLYPLLNAAHILAIGMLVTTAILMDARVLGLGRAIPVATVTAHLRPVAIGALIAAIVTGALLFSVQPVDYFANPVFRLKMVLLALAVVNALVFVRSSPGHPAIVSKFLATTSVLLWLGVLFCGRLIGFTE